MNTAVAMAAKALSPAARKACLAMTARREYPGRTTFTAGGAWTLRWTRPQIADVARVTTQTTRSTKSRDAYFLTAFGLEVQAHLRTIERPVVPVEPVSVKKES